jgi:hypothetical protein
MKRIRQDKTSLLCNSRWLSYAAAGAATALAGGTTAEAEIHYSGLLNLHFFNKHSFRQHQSFPLNEGALMWFARTTHGYPYISDKFGLFAAVSNQVRGVNFVGISRLEYGENVSHGAFFDMKQNRDYAFMRAPYGTGNFNRAGQAFIGFKFDQGNGTQYGWARVKMGGRPNQDKFILKDFAWADVGESITTGQTGSGGEPESATVPASGSLGFLALGGAGLLAWRKRRGDEISV